MVQIIENWAEIQGVVEDIHQHPKLNGYYQLIVKLEKSEAVKDFPNLAKTDEGKKVTINIKSDSIDEMKLKKEKSFHGLVRKATPTEYFYKEN
ncbi:MAG: hypothetical protein E6H08_18395 [Bacteroidetes bacterium]|nr:MAG: hypothetical protein E6H08_18395 [Bacteroidota bacterium]